jgi:hypothetical protein
MHANELTLETAREHEARLLKLAKPRDVPGERAQRCSHTAPPPSGPISQSERSIR